MKSVFKNHLVSKNRIGQKGITCLAIILSLLISPKLMALNESNEATTNANKTESWQVQKRTVTGKILDAQGVPLIGVNIMVKNSTIGIISDIDGKYSFDIPANSTLVFSYIGYKTLEVFAGEKIVVNVTMTEDAEQIEEVVVVGYGTQRKSDVIGSISVTSSEDILSSPTFNALQGLKGKAAGVTVFNGTGNPLGQDGNSVRVMIRGMNSINTNTDPLYVVDGVQMSEIQYINPNDIERMEVLKDASATAIYGARGANGVILITTKRGDTGHKGLTVSYNGYVSMATMARKMDVMNAQEFLEAEDIAFSNLSKYSQGQAFLNSLGVKEYFVDRSDPLIFDTNGNPLYDTDWQDVGTRNAISHSHQLNVQQQNQNSSIGAFFNYTDQEGLLHNNYAKRVSAKFTYDTKPREWFEFNSNIMVNHMWGNTVDDTGGGQTARRTMWEMPPILPVKFPDGSYSSTQYPGSKLNLGLEGMSNPLQELQERKKGRYRTKLFGNMAVVFHLADGLTLRSQFGLDANFRQDKNFSPNNLVGISSRGEAGFYNAQWLYWQEETYLNYNKLVKDKHRINATLGASWSKDTKQHNETGNVYDFDTNYYGYDNLGAGKTPSAPKSGYSAWTMNSYFARASYTYNDKYLMTATMRIDGSSRFGKNNKYGYFPSAGLGWVLSNEEFFNVKWISNLKLRTSYGRTGNTEIDPYKTLSTMASGTTLINAGRQVTSEISRMPNPDLEWEKTDQFDVGFNVGMFDNRINFEFDYYIKRTNDLLLDKPIPFTSGFSSVWDNIGEVENKGVDFMLSTTNIESKDFRWESTLNFNYNKNTILKLGDNNEDIIMGPDIQGGNTILRVGESMGSFYGYIRYGTWGTDEAAEAAKVNAIPGEAKRSSERFIIGNGLPDWTGSFINKFYYKNWDFTLDLQFVAGVDVWQQFIHTMEDRTGIANGLKSILYDSWTEQNQNTMVQQIRQQSYAGQNTMADSHWVSNGSYLRGNLIQLGYTFDNTLMKKLKTNSLRVYFSVNNAFLICSKDFKGYDPEGTTFNDKFSQNIMSFEYPSARTYTLGVNFMF